MTVEVVQFPCLADNYGYLLHDAESGLTATVDTPDVAAIETALSARGWTLTHIFNTHHHWDHAGGNQELKARHRCQIIGPRADRDRIPGIDVEVGEGDTFRFGTTDVEVYDTPGHTRGHIVFRIPEQNLAFVGDTLFAMGCGRLFEGTAEQMWSSLQKILAWPDETILYCAHEYTESNGEFAVTVDPDNSDLQQRLRWVREQRAQALPTVPTTLAEERATNPFLRPREPAIQRQVGMEGASAAAVLGEIRRLKDRF